MKKNDWILDVLADLRAFALSNGLPAISEQLDDTLLIAAGELRSQSNKGQTLGHGEADSAKQNFESSGCQHLA